MAKPGAGTTRRTRKPPPLGAVWIEGHRLDELRIPVVGSVPGGLEPTTPERRIHATLVEGRLELRIPTVLLAVLYFECLLPQDRQRSVAIAFGRGRPEDFHLVGFEVEIDEHGDEITTLTLLPAASSSMPANVVPFAHAQTSEWLFGLSELTHEVDDEGESYRPMVAVLLDPTNNRMFPAELGRRVDTELIAGVWRNAIAVADPPARVRVATPELAEQLRRVVPGLTFVIAPTPEIDALWADIARAFAAVDVAPTYSDEGRVPLESIEEFFAAALEFRRTKPWNQLARFVGSYAEIPALQRRVAVSVVRDEGLGGLAIHLDIDAFEAAYAAYSSGDEPIAPGDVVAVGFFAKRDLSEPLREELRGFAFAPARGPYPALLCVDADGRRRAPTIADYELAIVLLRTIPRYAKRTHEGSHSTTLAGREVRVEFELVAEVDLPF
ncbi:hypothetical protein ACNOYE_12440 [Nannocystaceae bacterium ST9]